MRRIPLLLCLLCGCATAPPAPIGAPVIEAGTRLAFFSGSYSDDAGLRDQFRKESANDLILREFSALAGKTAGERFVSDPELRRLYGKNHLPVLASEDSGGSGSTASPGPACDPRTASIVKQRLGVDAFLVIWTEDWPNVESIDAGRAASEGEGSWGLLRSFSFLVQAFSTPECRSLGRWRLRVLCKTVIAKPGMDEAQSRAFAGVVAGRIAEELKGPLRWPQPRP